MDENYSENGEKKTTADEYTTILYFIGIMYAYTDGYASQITFLPTQILYCITRIRILYIYIYIYDDSIICTYAYNYN